MASGLHRPTAVLTLILALACSQVDGEFSPPPPPPQVFSMQLQELSELRLLTTSLSTQLELSRQVTELSVSIATFDTSGPDWAKALRIMSYVLALPAFVFAAPIWSRESLAVAGMRMMSSQQTERAVIPIFNDMGVALTVAVGIAFVVGVTGGVVGWILKRRELDGLVRQKAALDQQWAGLAMRR